LATRLQLHDGPDGRMISACKVGAKVADWPHPCGSDCSRIPLARVWTDQASAPAHAQSGRTADLYEDQYRRSERNLHPPLRTRLTSSRPSRVRPSHDEIAQMMKPKRRPPRSDRTPSSQLKQCEYWQTHWQTNPARARASMHTHAHDW
jgi:hypothetical protein